MAGDIGTALRFEPGLGRERIGHGLDGGEGLAGNQKQGARWLDAFEHSGQLVPVDIRDEVEALARQHERIERQHRHLRAEVGAANADVHHVGDRLIRAHGLRVGQHGVQRGMHLRQLICYIICSILRFIHEG